MNNSPEQSPILKNLETTYLSLIDDARAQGLSEETLNSLLQIERDLHETLIFTDCRFDLPNEVEFYRVSEKILASPNAGEYAAMAFNIRGFGKANQYLGIYANNVLDAFLQGLKQKLAPDEYLFTKGSDDGYILCKADNIDSILEYLHCTTVEYNPDTHDTHEIRCAVGCNRSISTCKVNFMLMNSIALTLKISRKNKSQGTWCTFWEESLFQISSNEAKIESLIPNALKNNEFMVYYQPKVDLRNYELVGAEALCRWKHDDTMIFPDQFIPLMERNGTIGELDFYMLEHTCQDIRRWIDSGIDPVQVSVNLSRVNLQSESLLERIISTVDKYKVPHVFIQIELTETTTDVSFSELKILMEGLRNAGFTLAIDDFGTGYSSLSIIHNLPWNVIKIDKSLLHEHTDSKQDKHLMFKAIVHMVQALGLETIVEGVETPQDINLLKENDCVLAQGYFFDRPLPCSAFEDRLQANRIQQQKK